MFSVNQPYKKDGNTMKRFVSVLISIIFLLIIEVPATMAETIQDNKDDSYLLQLSSLIQEYSEDNYFEKMDVTIGESNLLLDGEEIPIDDNGTVAYVDNGRTMMPVRAIAEAIGADVSYEGNTQTVTVESDEKIILMSIDESEMSVNGEKVELLNAPKIVNDRTMLPVRDVAEALDCEVSWNQETETATFTRPLQTKRLIVFSENVNKENAVASIQGDGFTILQFDKISDAADYIDKYGTNGSGASMAKYILKRAFQEFNIRVILRWPFDMAARFIGMKVGKK